MSCDRCLIPTSTQKKEQEQDNDKPFLERLEEFVKRQKLASDGETDVTASPLQKYISDELDLEIQERGRRRREPETVIPTYGHNASLYVDLSDLAPSSSYSGYETSSQPSLTDGYFSTTDAIPH